MPYEPLMDLRQTERAIRTIKEYFQTNLADALNLTEEELDELMDLATQPVKSAGARLSAQELERLRKSRSLDMFTRRKPE